MGGVVGRDVGVALDAWDVDQRGPAAVGSRPVVVAAGGVGAHFAGVLVVVGVRAFRVDLQVLRRIIIDRLTGLRIDALGPGHLLDVLHRLDELAAGAIERVVEAVAAGVRDDLAVLAVHLGVNQDVGTGLVVVAVVVRGVLVPPRNFAGRRVEGDRARGVEIVAGAVAGVIARHRIPRAPDGEIGGRVVGAGDVERAAAGLPGVVLVQPGFAAGLARRRNREGLPPHVAGLRIERRHPVAHALIAAGGADDEGILERDRRGVELELGLIVQLLVPDDLAGLLVGRDD